MQFEIDRDGAVRRFSGTITYKTVSSREAYDLSPFRGLHAFIRDNWPLLHDRARCETVAEGSLLFTIPGSDLELPPALLTAHLDVVPVEDENSELWKRPPWSGEVADGRVWGRGTVDYKAGVAGMLEACQILLGSGFIPRRTIILAFGHDEEVGGVSGSTAIVELLEKRGVVNCSFIIDEGGYIFSFPWMERDTAVIGVAEKGYLTIEILAVGQEGHASRPVGRTPVGLVAEAVSVLEMNGMPIHVCSPVRTLLERISDSDPVSYAEHISKWPEGNALVRTTTAPTVIAGSLRENMISAVSRALVNFRISPGQSISDVVAHVSGLLENIGVEFTVLDNGSLAEPSGVSSVDSPVFQTISRSLAGLYPEAIVTPGIFIAATDSRRYEVLTRDVYRILPVRLGGKGMGMLHSSGESVAVEDYLRCIRFYAEVLENTCGS